MADIDLSALSLMELKALRKDLDKAITTFEARKRKEALAAAKAAAAEAGFDLSELMHGSKKPKSSAPAKYKHPENPSLTWSGRGRQPAWYKELIEAGTEQEELLIS